MRTNEFAKISELVSTILNRYREVRKDCNIPDDGWHSRTIERIAKPFIKGYFTLAVVGKVSSGKSTFINALLGCKDLLPTGHDQTTCGITYIEYGDIPELTIIFGDGHEEVIRGDIRGKIKPYVAIPEKYHHLPVNNIDDMIMGGFDFNKIWNVRNQLEKETNCTSLDKNKELLKDYVEHREKKDIAVEIHMKYPFSEELRGWRVIDTPGIGAIGGIEYRTKKLLATQKDDGSREVDAIIFLQDGSQTLDQTDSKKFVKDQLDNFTESDKNRLFYVLTHSGSSDFLYHKDSKIDFINQNYGDKIKCLTYADSLLYSFLCDPKCSDADLKFFDDIEKPEDWADDEWTVIMSILFQAKQHIKKIGDTFNHDTMLRTIQEWAHFENLKNDINKFAKNEKQKTLRDLIKLINSDYKGFVKQLAKDKKLVDGDLRKINSEIKSVRSKRLQYNKILQKVDTQIKKDKINSEFKFIDTKLMEFEMLKTYEEIRTSITNLFNLVQKREKEVFAEIIQIFSGFFNDYDPNDLIIQSIDFVALEVEAGNFDRENYVIEPAHTETHFCDPDELIPAKYDYTKIEEEKFHNFKALAIKTARSQRDSFLPQVNQKIDKLRQNITCELNQKLNDELSRLSKLEHQLSQKEKFKAENDKYIKESRTASRELIKIAKDYGFKF